MQRCLLTLKEVVNCFLFLETVLGGMIGRSSSFPPNNGPHALHRWLRITPGDPLASYPGHLFLMNGLGTRVGDPPDEDRCALDS